MDQAFLKRLREVVEENLDIEQFGVRELAREVGLSCSLVIVSEYYGNDANDNNSKTC